MNRPGRVLNALLTLRSPGLAGLLALAFILGGCGEGTGDAPAFTAPVERDSAGVTIVENPPAAALDAVWRLGAEPLVRIGILDGPAVDQLFRVRGALRTSDGSVVVANAGTHEIRVYDANGRHVASWGGEGDGPGEFRSIFSLDRWPGDSLAVWDLRTRRISVLTAEGGYARTFPIPQPAGVNLPRPAGLLDSGELVLSEVQLAGEDGTPRSGRRRSPLRVSVVEPDGSGVRDLGTHPGPETHLLVEEQRIEIFSPAYARSFVLEPAAGEVLISPSERFELRFWDLDGSLTRIVRLGEAPVVVSDADREADLARRLEGAPPEAHPGIRATRDRMPLPDTLPALAAVVRSATGDYWVEPYRLEGSTDSVTWIVVDAAGRTSARIEIPAAMTVHQIGSDYLVASVTDELGVERVEVWPVERGG